MYHFIKLEHFVVKQDVPNCLFAHDHSLKTRLLCECSRCFSYSMD